MKQQSFLRKAIFNILSSIRYAMKQYLTWYIDHVQVRLMQLQPRHGVVQQREIRLTLISIAIVAGTGPNIFHPLYQTRKIIYWGSGSLIRIHIPEILCLHLSPSTLCAQYSKAILILVLVGGYLTL